MGRVYGKKILCMAAAILVCAAVIGNKAQAENGSRSDGIGSHGMVNYDNGRILFNAADLTKLADRIDKVEFYFKSEVAGALARIGTYVQQDGSTSHDIETDIDVWQITFADLAAAILESQSVTHLRDTQASNDNGMIYYKFIPNNLLEVTNNDTGMPVYIQTASEDNLTAQTSAWVDGHCLVGNGSDNYYFYQKGFIEGYAAKVGARVEYSYDDMGRMESAKLIFP